MQVFVFVLFIFFIAFGYVFNFLLVCVNLFLFLQERVDKSTTSKDVEFPPRNALFAVTVLNSFGPRFGSKVLDMCIFSYVVFSYM